MDQRLKCIKDQNIKTDMLNMLEDRRGKTLEDFGIGKILDFMNKTLISKKLL